MGNPVGPVALCGTNQLYMYFWWGVGDPRTHKATMLFAIAFAALLCIVTASPVQVFILLGQSNMLGMGYVFGSTPPPSFPPTPPA